jgi:hypothetical protein
MLKWAGRGHDISGVDATQPGDCAVECPACPHPNQNLPEGWEEAPDHIRYIVVHKKSFYSSWNILQMAVLSYSDHRCQFSHQAQGKRYHGEPSSWGRMGPLGQFKAIPCVCQKVWIPGWGNCPKLLQCKLHLIFLNHSQTSVTLSWRQSITLKQHVRQHTEQMAMVLSYVAAIRWLAKWEISKRARGVFLSCIHFHALLIRW